MLNNPNYYNEKDPTTFELRTRLAEKGIATRKGLTEKDIQDLWFKYLTDKYQADKIHQRKAKRKVIKDTVKDNGDYKGLDNLALLLKNDKAPAVNDKYEQQLAKLGWFVGGLLSGMVIVNAIMQAAV